MRSGAGAFAGPCLDYQPVYAPHSGRISSWSASLAACGLLLAALSFKVWVKIESTQAGYELGRERQKTVQYDMERRELELQLSVLLRPDNLELRAGRLLGLKPLRPGQTVRLAQ